MRRLLAASALLLLVAGCSSLPSLNPFNWFGGGAAGPAPAPLPVLRNPQPLKVLWSTGIGGAGSYIFTPALARGSVYAASHDGTVARFDAATGSTRWQVNLDEPLSAGVGSDGRLVVVATDEGRVIALDADNGKLRWRAHVSSEVLAAPRLANGLVLVRSDDSSVYAFDASTGKQRWYYQRSSPVLSVRSPSGLTLHGDTVYAGFAGKLVALALETGGVRWDATVSVAKGATELERMTDVTGRPAVAGNEVCAAAYQGRVACFGTRNGGQLWSRPLSTVTGVSVGTAAAFVSDVRGAVYAYDRVNGGSLWKQDKLAYRQLSMPLQIGKAVAVGDLQGYVHLLAADSGAFLARIGTDGSAIRAAPIALPGGGFLVQTRDGGLYALAR